MVKGGLVTPGMGIMMRNAMNPRVMQRFTQPRPMMVLVWLATLVVGLVTISALFLAAQGGSDIV